MSTIFHIAIRAPREVALPALAEALGARESEPPVAFDDPFDMNDAINDWMGPGIHERIDGWPVGVVDQRPWTLLYVRQIELPIDRQLLGSLSARVGERVVGFVMQTTSGAYGLLVFRDGTLERHFFSVDGELVEDEGSLGDDDDLASDPSRVEEIWDALVPSEIEVENCELRVFVPSPPA